MTTPTPDAVLSRPVVVEEIPFDGLTVTVSPDRAEREALARLNGLVAVTAMTAALRLRPEPGGGVRVTGEVVADVTQTCVVSLEAFDAVVREPVDVECLPPAALAAYHAARAKSAADEDTVEDEPDAILHGRIDVGALAAEHLTLGLDPYPRKPGAQLPPSVTTQEAPLSPFAVLQTRKGESS